MTTFDCCYKHMKILHTGALMSKGQSVFSVLLSSLL